MQNLPSILKDLSPAIYRDYDGVTKDNTIKLLTKDSYKSALTLRPLIKKYDLCLFEESFNAWVNGGRMISVRKIL